MGSSDFSFLFFLCFCQLSFCSSIPHICRKDQSSALLEFKRTLIVDTSLVTCSSYSYTSSWNMSIDCCSWDGVVCNETTGHVIELNLSCSGLVGKIDSNSSLFRLSYLQRLDLSSNNFSNTNISPEFGRFSSLTYFDLSDSYFSGQIPSEISHLSKLQSLYFSGEMLQFGPRDFEMLLQNSTQLRELHLTSINISSTIPPNFSSHLTTLSLGSTGLYGIIPECIFQLPRLETLVLQNNDQLSGYFPKTKWNSSASLVELDLSGVNFSCNVPESIGYLTSLHSLSLKKCNLRGPIPESLSNLKHILDMDLSDNSLNGTIPSGMFSLPSLNRLVLSNNHVSGMFEDFKSNSLTWIDLSNNQLQGHLPNSIQNLVNLTGLILSLNNFSGHVDVSFFSDLKQLCYLEGCIPQGNQFHTFENNSYEGNDGLRGFPFTRSCGDDRVSGTNHAVSGQLEDEESNSEFLCHFWKAALMGYGSGLCIGLSIIYFMISTGNLKWLVRIIEELEHKIMMARRKAPRKQRNFCISL